MRHRGAKRTPEETGSIANLSRVIDAEPLSIALHSVADLCCRRVSIQNAHRHARVAIYKLPRRVVLHVVNTSCLSEILVCNSFQQTLLETLRH
jgi:hypothetical protein